MNIREKHALESQIRDLESRGVPMSEWPIECYEGGRDCPPEKNARPCAQIESGYHRIMAGPVSRGPVRRAQRTRNSHASLYHLPVRRGPVSRGPVRRGPVSRGPVRRGPVSRGPVRRGPVPHVTDTQKPS